MVVGVGGRAVCVGVDDESLLERLRPWQIDFPTSLVDYGLELSPGQPDDVIRPLPRLAHGTCDLVRSHDQGALTQALFRILGSLQTEPKPGSVRLRLMPLIYEGRALLVPVDHGGRISARWYERRGITPVYSVTTVVDTTSLSVVIDPELGASSSDSIRYPLMGWWLPSGDPTAALTPGFAVAFAMAMVDRVDGSSLGDIAALVDRMPPALVPKALDHVLERYDAPRGERIRETVREQLKQTLTR